MRLRDVELDNGSNTNQRSDLLPSPVKHLCLRFRLQVLAISRSPDEAARRVYQIRPVRRKSVKRTSLRSENSLTIRPASKTI